MTSRSEQIKQAVGIRQVVERYGIVLKRNACCCPFHQEKTPSFYINEQKNMFKCFGCGRGGDIFTFVQLYLNCDFKTALSEINNTFNLGIDGKISKRQMAKIQDEKRKKEAFYKWFSNTEAVLCSFFQKLRTTASMPQEYNDMNFCEYLLDIMLACRDADSKIQFYKDYREEVEKLERRISGYRK